MNDFDHLQKIPKSFERAIRWDYTLRFQITNIVGQALWGIQDFKDLKKTDS